MVSCFFWVCVGGVFKKSEESWKNEELHFYLHVDLLIFLNIKVRQNAGK